MKADVLKGHEKYFYIVNDPDVAEMLWQEGALMFRLYDDGTESMIEHCTEFIYNDEWVFGVEKELIIPVNK